MAKSSSNATASYKQFRILIPICFFLILFSIEHQTTRTLFSIARQGMEIGVILEEPETTQKNTTSTAKARSNDTETSQTIETANTKDELSTRTKPPPPTSASAPASDVEYEEPLPVSTVAYVITIASCTFRLNKIILDAAAVLKKSIELSSYPTHPTARYAAEFFAIVSTADAQGSCAQKVQSVGFQLQVHELPVKGPEDIAIVEGALPPERMKGDGCCGHNELLKLHAFSFTNHSVVVQLDLDTLLLRPMEELFDVMIHPPHTLAGKWARRSLVTSGAIAPTYQPVVPITEMTFEAFYTKDYNMVPQGQEDRIGVQGGVMIVRPNITRRDELIAMAKSGNFFGGRGGSKEKSGWFQSGYGLHIYGAMTIQGLLAYYYDLVAHENAVELHRCKYNQIVDNPRRSSIHHVYPRRTPLDPNATEYDTTCRDGRPDCEDVQCQIWPVVDTRIAHYTYCKKPWDCTEISEKPMYKGEATCQRLFQSWFDVRKMVKGKEDAKGSHHPDIFKGFCDKKNEYIHLQQ